MAENIVHPVIIHPMVAPQIERMIWHSLDNYLYRNATFLAERLYAFDKENENALYLLATCHYRSGNRKNAYKLLQGSHSPKCVYLFAKCCLELDRAEIGREKLLSILPEVEGHDSLDIPGDPFRCDKPDESVVLCLLGALCRKTKSIDEAALHYMACLKKNPFMWEAFEALCQLGKSTQIDLQEIFQPPNDKSTPRIPCTDILRPQFISSKILSRPERGNHAATPRRSSRISSNKSTTIQSQSLIDTREKKRTRIMNEEKTSNNTTMMSIDDENKRSRTNIHSNKHVTDFENEGVSNLGLIYHDMKKTKYLLTLSILYMKKGIEDTKEDQHIKFNNNTSDDDRRIARIEILDLLKKCARGLSYVSEFECHKAIAAFAELPKAQYETPWVYAQLGKAHFELVDYPRAEHCFQWVRNVEPFRMEDMEIYSTALWHMRKDVALSTLAHELVEYDRRSPQAWCAVGNCFSRQQEQDMALKCFQRAIQLDPSFTYAHTLSGHECMANGNFEKAQEHFRNAINTNRRHYNAWYGLANYYATCGKKQSAERHYRAALDINPNHAVLICCLGKVLEKMNRFQEARALYDRACEVTPNTPLAKFKKAKSLFREHEYQVAIKELDALKTTVPKEPKVYFLLGKIYKALGDRVNSTQNFTAALQQDPKMAHVIKSAMEKLDPDLGNDSSMALSNT
ncbi:7634_t:CDS:2 [Ambispora gerdemannii]|uniref:7634_t:CDS:1 n=1 Tax=Ambispora gerdemannii TaxID=144530 RepID=A0A9N9A550_9GLOM|nr:7634_t:CDS:2 [Ambispora gerdemannii]